MCNEDNLRNANKNSVLDRFSLEIFPYFIFIKAQAFIYDRKF